MRSCSPLNTSGLARWCRTRRFSIFCSSRAGSAASRSAGLRDAGGSPDSSSNSSIRSSAAPRRPSRLSIPSAKGIGMGSIFAVTVPALRWWVALSFPASNPAG
ncbi:Uncharacterised protein [Mycobacterium tuberculosis]|uniref:Uncharacterized protein n=1 Tax=Mycobacterium tuberculosis TaxID=1773 RepID=A0A916PAL7_MYCTX|nr:Uncharacterised protein [Mycobacterium tuberculosis]